MTVFTDTWNAAFEALPADTDNRSEGADRIRELKVAVSERMKVDHSWAGDALDGYHKFVTLTERSVDPSAVTDAYILYAKDDNGRSRLFQCDSVGGAIGPLLTDAKGHLFGLTLSNSAGDVTNDLDIAAGQAWSESAIPGLMVLASGLTKRLDAAWAVGTGQGGLSTGAIANTTYHTHLIRRPDTGVVDVLFDVSAAAPTMPANYTQRRRIGSLQRVAGAWQVFKQFGDEFRLNTSVSDINLTGLSSGTANRILASLPAGLEVEAVVHGVVGDAGVVTRLLYVDYPGESDASNGPVARTVGGETDFAAPIRVRVNTSKQVQTTLTGAGATGIIVLTTRGWIDARGRLA